MRSRLVLAVAVLVLGTTLAGPVAAKPLEHEKYAGSDTFTVADVCGTDWIGEVTFSGNFMLKAIRGDETTPPYFFDNYRYQEVWRDASDPSRVVIHEGNALWRDQHITLVEGTTSTYHFVIHEVGRPSIWRTPAGEIIYRDRGHIVWEFTVDTRGDQDLSNDEFLSDPEPTAIHGPHPNLMVPTEQEFCAAINAALDA